MLITIDLQITPFFNTPLTVVTSDCPILKDKEIDVAGYFINKPYVVKDGVVEVGGFKPDFENCNGESLFNVRTVDGGLIWPHVWIADLPKDPNSIMILSHELLHSVFQILRNKDIHVVEETDEVYCQLHGYLLESALEQFNKINI